MTLAYRMDQRTIEQFARDIKFRTYKEKYLMHLYVREMSSLGYKVKVINYGSDNSGALCKNVTARPDYKLFIQADLNNDKEYLVYLVDIKNSPVSSKWTFKVFNLQSYVKYDANILIFWGTGYIEKNPENINLDKTFFGIITPQKLDSMIESYQHYKEPKFGNKICIQIPSKDFDRWLTIKRITHHYEKEDKTDHSR